MNKAQQHRCGNCKQLLKVGMDVIGVEEGILSYDDIVPLRDARFFCSLSCLLYHTEEKVLWIPKDTNQLPECGLVDVSNLLGLFRTKFNNLFRKFRLSCQPKWLALKNFAVVAASVRVWLAPAVHNYTIFKGIIDLFDVLLCQIVPGFIFKPPIHILESGDVIAHCFVRSFVQFPKSVLSFEFVFFIVKEFLEEFSVLGTDASI